MEAEDRHLCQWTYEPNCTTAHEEGKRGQVFHFDNKIWAPHLFACGVEWVLT